MMKNYKDMTGKRSRRPKDSKVVSLVVAKLEQEQRYSESDRILNAAQGGHFLAGGSAQAKRRRVGRAVRLAKRVK